MYSWTRDFLCPLVNGSRPPVDLEELTCAQILVADTWGQGRCLQAAERRDEGGLVLVEQACYECVSAELPQLVCDNGFRATAAWECLSPMQRRRLAALSPGRHRPPPTISGVVPLPRWRGLDRVTEAPSGDWMMGVAKHNAMEVVSFVEHATGLCSLEADYQRPTLGLFAIGGLMNHSCLPSARATPYPGWLVVRVAHDLMPGEELTTTYTDVRRPLHIRRASLEKSWGFQCSCARCRLEERVWEAGDRVASEELWRSFETIAKGARRSSEAALVQILVDAVALIDQAVEQFLSSISSDSGNSTLLGALRPAFRLSKGQRGAVVMAAMGEETIELPKDREAVVAFTRLRNLMLASLWLSPASTYVSGLIGAGRFEEAKSVGALVVEVTREVLPNSMLHVAEALRRMTSAAEVGVPSETLQELVGDACAVLDRSIGDGVEALRLLTKFWLERGSPGSHRLRSLLAATIVPKLPITRQDGLFSRGHSVFFKILPPTGSLFSDDGPSRSATTSGDDQVVGQSSLVVLVEDVGDPTAINVDISRDVVRIAGAFVPTPCAIDVEAAKARWNGHKRIVTVVAPCLSKPVG